MTTGHLRRVPAFREGGTSITAIPGPPGPS